MTTETTFTARSPSGTAIRTAEPTVAAELSRGGYRVSAVTVNAVNSEP